MGWEGQNKSFRAFIYSEPHQYLTPTSTSVAEGFNLACGTKRTSAYPKRPNKNENQNKQKVNEHEKQKILVFLPLQLQPLSPQPLEQWHHHFTTNIDTSTSSITIAIIKAKTVMIASSGHNCYHLYHHQKRRNSLFQFSRLINTTRW